VSPAQKGIAEAVIPAHDLIDLDVPRTEGKLAVITKIRCRSDGII
jgi:hypothetical protein